MNAERRKIIEEIKAKLSQIHADLESPKEDEQSAFDNMPESLQQGERGTQIEENVQYMDEALDNIQSAIDALDNIQ